MPHILIALKLAGALGVLGAGVWVADVIGDRREARVRAEYAAAIATANTRAEQAQEYWRAHYEAQFAERIGTLKAIEAAVAQSGPAAINLPPDLLAKLNAVQPRRR